MITYFFKTYGCQANVADSLALETFLSDCGCQPVKTEPEADIIIINTCAVREKAEQKLWSYLGKLQPLKLARPYIKIGVIGCVASYKKDELYNRFDHISFVYSARDELELLQVYLADVVVTLQSIKQRSGPTKSYGQDRDVKALVARKSLLSKRLSLFAQQKKQSNNVVINPGEVGRSWVNIMTGCNKYCSYCIVPFTRGREVSFPMSQILERVARDVAAGAKEVTLIGQNVNSYQDPETGARFPELLRRVAAIEGDFWVRFISPHPYDMTVDLFDVMAQYRPKITAYLHFPVQSGSNRILSLMNRHYTAEQYLEKIGWIVERMPDATISTDIIVGFPGETEEDFVQTMDIVNKVKFDLIYSFIYSSRKYTKASQMPDDCLVSTKQARLDMLQERQTAIALERNQQNIGKTLTCLVEKRLEHGKLLARTEGNIRVLFDGSDDCIGKFVKLFIDSTGPAQMSAKLVTE